MDGDEQPRPRPDVNFDKYGITDHGFKGLLPGSKALEGDWNFDVDNVGNKQSAAWNVSGPIPPADESKVRGFRMYMAGVSQPQPLMVDDPDYSDELYDEP